MRPAWIRAVAAKELLATIRDRRALISNLLIPLLVLPTVMLGLPLLMGGLFEREQASLTRIAIQGDVHLPAALRAYLTAQNVQPVVTDDALSAVRDDQASAGLIVPDGFADAVSGGTRPRLQVLAKVGNLESELAATKVTAAVSAYRQELVAATLGEVGLDPSVLEPIVVDRRDASRPEERSSGQLAWLIPFFIAVWSLAGGQMVALDATAGEKERGTLEALLVAPVRRSEVVAGKFLATATAGLSASFMAIVGVLVGGVLLRRVFLPRLGEEATEMVAVMGGVPIFRVETLWILLGSAVLLAGVVAALLIAVAMFARSFKEAQTYVAPLSFLMVVPALALQFSDLLDLGQGIYLVPILNVMVLIDDVLGGSVAAGDVWTSWLVMALTVAALLAFALRSFQREGVIFRA